MREVPVIGPVLRALGGALVPPRCIACHRLTPDPHDQGLCSRCRSELAGPPAPPSVAAIERLLAATSYRGVAVRLVAAIKSGSLPAAAETAAELCAERLPPASPDAVLVPVPASPLAAIRRGSDPAAALAEALGCRLSAAVVPALRRRDRGRQRGRTRSRRLADPPIIEAAGTAPIAALIVDDVVTTGATLRACAEALRSAGSERVDAIVFAATPEPPALDPATAGRRMQERFADEQGGAGEDRDSRSQRRGHRGASGPGGEAVRAGGATGVGSGAAGGRAPRGSEPGDR